MAFWLIAVGVAAAAQVGTTIASGVVADNNAKKGIEHQKDITYLNAVSEIISSQSNAPKAIPQ
jgi:hypothetical protein